MNCFNGEQYLREALDSIFCQTYENWEIIFWDNASTDDTQQIATSYDSRLKYFRSEINTPLGPARNRALEKATATYVAFLDSDDIYLPYALQKQAGLMESGEYGLVYAGMIIVDENGKEKERSKLRYNSGYIFDNLLRRYDIPMCSVMIRRSVIDGEGLRFVENLEYCPDYNLFMKIAAQHKIGVIHEPVYKYRRVPGSLSRKMLHLVSKEHRQTLDELEELYPDAVRSCGDAMIAARLKHKFYDAINYINMENYQAARSALKPVIGCRWEYLVIYLILFLPVPKAWLLRILNR